MTNWDDFKCLMHLARSQTMTNAALALKTNVSTVSRRLERLNSSLAEPALVKFGNGWKLTSYGEKLAEADANFQVSLNQIETEEINVQNAKQVSRKITLSAPMCLYRHTSVDFLQALQIYIPELSLTSLLKKNTSAQPILPCTWKGQSKGA